MKNRIRKAFAIFLALTFIFGLSPFGKISFSVSVASSDITPLENGITPASGGTYTISSAEQLSLLSAIVRGGNSCSGAVFILTQDIELNEYSLSADENGEPLYNGAAVSETNKPLSWLQIGTYASSTSNLPFSGTFDGDGHTVSGIFFDDIDESEIGLFGFSTGIIKNLGVVNSYFRSTYVGGICGDNRGTITNCYNAATVTGDLYVGGICGESRGTITSCYNTGSISCTENYIGGICGYSNTGSILNSYNIGSVSGGAVSGGVCGKTSAAQITSCFYLDTCGAAGDGAGKTESEMKAADIITELGSPFMKSYYSLNSGYPLLRVFYEFSDNGKGTASNPYQIYNANQLIHFSYLVNNQNSTYGNKYYRLMNDIIYNSGILTADSSGNPLYNGIAVSATNVPRTWTATGNDSYQFNGVFDGRGFVISGLYINKTAQDCSGLFGNSHGTIKNVSIVNSFISGKSNYVGGVCGKNYGTITDCSNTGFVSGIERFVGGVCGANHGTITGCSNTGTVRSTGMNTGGVCGTNYNTVTDCSNTGAVTNTDSFCGGVCGLSFGTVNNSNNTGRVSGTNFVGGVCGSLYSFGADKGTVSNCFNTGKITGTTRIGGICGGFYNDNGMGEISNCFYLNTSASYGYCDMDNNTFSAENKAEAKTTAQFSSGEIAWKLQNGADTLVWGQRALGTADSLPALESDEAYRILRFGKDGDFKYLVKSEMFNLDEIKKAAVGIPANAGGLDLTDAEVMKKADLNSDGVVDVLDAVFTERASSGHT